MEGKNRTFDGARIYSAAIVMTDKYERRFCDMLAADSKESEIEREYFTDEFSEIPCLGWQEFCRLMADAGQGEWLDKIVKLDEEVLLSTMERKLLSAVETKNIDKESLDATVKAITGLVGRSKILSEQRGAAIANSEIIIKIINSKTDEEVGGNCEALAKEGSNGGRT